MAAAFGGIDKPVLILPAGDDEMVPPAVDRKALLERWAGACNGAASGLSGFVPGADHVLSGAESQAWVAARVEAFLGSL